MLVNFKKIENVIDQTIVDSKDISLLAKFHWRLCGILGSYVCDEKESFITLIHNIGNTVSQHRDNINKYRTAVNRHVLIVLGSISHYEPT